eukprot:COSAG05_NODE_4331_length_1563_cov_3.361339_1_plen_213_part_00
MRKVLATRLEFRKGGSDATEYCREAKNLAERLEQLVRSSKWLSAILEAMTPTQSQYDSFAVKNTSFHELLRTARSEGEAFQLLTSADERFGDTREWIEAEIAYSVRLIAFHVDEADPQQDFQAPHALSEAADFEFRQSAVARVRSLARASPEPDAALQESKRQLQQQQQAMQQAHRRAFEETSSKSVEEVFEGYWRTKDLHAERSARSVEGR